MSAYCFFNNVKISDQKKMEEYRHAVFDVVKKFKGEYVVIGGPFNVKEGAPKIDFPIMIRFPTMALARAWYDSPEYAPLLKLRQEAGEFDAVFMEGC